MTFTRLSGVERVQIDRTCHFFTVSVKLKDPMKNDLPLSRMCNPCVFLFTHTSSLSVYQLEPVGDNQSVESGEYAQLLGTNGRWHAGLGKEVMVELSGYGSANGK